MRVRDPDHHAVEGLVIRDLRDLRREVARGNSFLPGVGVRSESVEISSDRRFAGATAPAAGLCLWRVEYPQVFAIPTLKLSFC